MRPLLTSLCAFLCAFSAALAHADAPPRIQEVKLLTVSETWTFVKEQIDVLEKQGYTVDSAEITHVGEFFPKPTKALAIWLASKKIALHNYHFSPQSLEAELDKKMQDGEVQALNLAKLLRYETDPKSKDSDTEIKKSFRARTLEIRDEIRNYFGVPQGPTFLTYLVHRTRSEKVFEGSIAALKMGVGSYVIYHSVLSKINEGAILNLPASIAISAVFNLVFDYWQRGNSAFKGQGLQFHEKYGVLPVNPRFYLLVAFIHSFVVRESIMAAAHITNQGFSMGWNDFFQALTTTTLGLIGKAPIEQLIEKFRRTHSKWWAIGVMTSWGMIWSSLQVADLFHVGSVLGYKVGDMFRYILIGASGGATIWSVVKNRGPIYLWLQRTFDRDLARRQTAECQTLLVFKVSPRTNE